MMQDEAGDLCMGMVNTAARLAPLLPDDLRSCPLGEATALPRCRSVQAGRTGMSACLVPPFHFLILKMYATISFV